MQWSKYIQDDYLRGVKYCYLGNLLPSTHPSGHGAVIFHERIKPDRFLPYTKVVLTAQVSGGPYGETRDEAEFSELRDAKTWVEDTVRSYIALGLIEAEDTL